MDAVGLLVDAFGRVRETAHDAVEGLTGEELVARLDADANSIAWLVWHLTRVQDDHVADVAGVEQVYTAGGWATWCTECGGCVEMTVSGVVVGWNPVGGNLGGDWQARVAFHRLTDGGRAVRGDACGFT